MVLVFSVQLEVIKELRVYPTAGHLRVGAVGPIVHLVGFGSQVSEPLLVQEVLDLLVIEGQAVHITDHDEQGEATLR